MQSRQAIEEYVVTCREVLKAGGNDYSKWLFDERVEFPDVALFRSFEMSQVRGSVHDYLVYFEIYLDSERKRGGLSIFTLEVGPGLYQSEPLQSRYQILEDSNALIFETTNEKHHLECKIEFDRCQEGGISSFRTAKYSLTLIHPGTKEPTNTVCAIEYLDYKKKEINCPKCLGKGVFISMAIPEAAYNSGLSGYALYSENTICSHTGCNLCGGSGKSFEEWYLKEKSISTEIVTPLIQGRGRVVIGTTSMSNGNISKKSLKALISFARTACRGPLA